MPHASVLALCNDALPPKAPEAGRPTRGEAEAAVATLLRWVGQDPTREGLRGTPDRFVRAFRCYYEVDPHGLLERTFEEVVGFDDVVLPRDIEFVSHCEHHLAPINGKVHVAYLPAGRVVGISKLARVVDAYARRLQIQERLTAEIAACIDEALKPRGVAVMIEVTHGCMSMRGVNKQGVSMMTHRLTGAFRSDEALRREFFAAARYGA